MKYVILLVIFLSVLVSPVYAVTPTPTGGSLPTQKVTEKLSEQINALKERIASRVAQLNLVEKRGIIGMVKDASGTKITLSDLSGNTRFVDVDEITKFSSLSSKNANFGISDLTQGAVVRVLGNYNKQSKRILARFVDEMVVPTVIDGVVSDISKADFTLTVATETNKGIIVDIENTTKTSSYTDATSVTKTGFSKITVGQRVHVVGFPNKKESNRITASRILLFPELKVNPKINISTIQDESTVTPATKKSTP